MKTTVIGSGVFGIAIANLLNASGNKVTMWTEKEDTNKIIVPNGIDVTNDFKTALDGAKLVFILTSAIYTPEIFKSIRTFLDKNAIVILGSKGILKNGNLIETELKKIIPRVKYAIMSGPTFALDVAELEPLGFTIATKKRRDFDYISKFLKNVKLEYTKDTTGTCLCGVLKNSYAIGSGLLDGLHYGPSVRCLYITEVIYEIKNILRAYKCNVNTANLLCGIGDLTLTCTSLNSRNYTFGSILGLGSKKEKEEYLKNNTVEGFENLKVLIKLFKEKSIDAPILKTVYDIVINDKDTLSLTHLLLR